VDHTKRFAAEARQLGEIRRFIGECAKAASFTGEAEDLELAATEAASNVIRHASSDSLEVHLSAGPAAIVVEVRDHGVFKERPAAPSLADEGRGIAIMKAVVDEFAIAPGTPGGGGTVVRLVKRNAAALPG
jgi:serine/threonine-protein kinase RsbW